jgi:3-carboxy-cis,cis-muconate cycloisomerase
MQVFPQKMRADLDMTHGLIMAEAVTLALAAFIGKADAHHRIEALCRQAIDESRPLQELLENDPLVSQHLATPFNAVAGPGHGHRQRRTFCAPGRGALQGAT